jgi:cytochrome P450
VGDGLFVSDGATWQRRRPLVADIVHRNRMLEFAEAMETAVAETLEQWACRPKGMVFDALQDMAELAAQTVSRAVFDEALSALEVRQVVGGFAQYQRLIDSVNVGYFLGADEGWPVFRGVRLRRSTKRIHEVIATVFNAHIAHGAGIASMSELLSRRQVRSPDLELDAEALRSEAATLFMAGHETTATTLAWAWYLLANAPWVETAVHDEIAAVVGSRRPRLADVPALNWCRAVIEETLRLYPPVPILARQATGRDCIGDIEVEPAALIMIVPWLLHRSADLWERPHDFLPERFLGTTRPEPYTYIPFATGPRVCPGMTFGLSEAVLGLATLAQRFRVRVAPGHTVVPLCHLSLRPRGGLPVFLEDRR